MCSFGIQFHLLIVSTPDYEGTEKFRISFFSKVLNTLVGTTTHLHVHNTRTMQSRQPTVSLLYVLATAFANRESQRVTLHTSSSGCHALLKKVYTHWF